MKQKYDSIEQLVFFGIKLYFWIIIAFAALILVFLIITGYGHVEALDTDMQAVVITADSDVLTTKVSVQGEYTTYPFGGLFGSGRDIFESDPGEGISVNGKPVIYRIDFPKDREDYLYMSHNDQPSFPAQYIVKRECEEFIFCMDGNLLYPNQKEALCLVVAPAESLAAAKNILKSLPELPLQTDFSQLIEAVLTK